MDCNFCGIRIPKGTEFIHVTSKGKALYFCTGKCHKNLIKLGRKPRHVKWTNEYRVEKEARVKLLAEHNSAPAKAESKKEDAREEKQVKAQTPEGHKKVQEAPKPKKASQEKKAEKAKKPPKK